MTAPFWKEGVERLLGTTIVLMALPGLNASGVSVGLEKLRSYGPRLGFAETPKPRYCPGEWKFSRVMAGFNNVSVASKQPIGSADSEG